MAGSPNTSPTPKEPRRSRETAAWLPGALSAAALETVSEGVVLADCDGLIVYMNPFAERLIGVDLTEARGKPVTKIYPIVSETTRLQRQDPVEICLRERRTVVLPGLFLLQTHQGDEHIIRDTVSPIFGSGSEDELQGVVLVFKDLTRIRGLEKQMVYLTSHDTLTGLINRQEFEIYLEAALESSRDLGLAHTLLQMNVLELKLINDYFGLIAGDELLRRVGDHLRRQVGEMGILGRLGGDDFGLLLENRDHARAQRIAEALQRSFRSFRFSWGGQDFDIGLAIGMVPFRPASDSALQLLKNSDAACYLARQSRNRIHTFAPSDTALAERHGPLHWVHRIRRALAEDRFSIFLQEIRPLAQQRRSHRFFEALVRMIDDEGKIVAPGQFIPVAEDHDLAPLVDRWVVRRTLRMLAQNECSLLSGASVSINLSGRSLGDEAFLEEVSDYIDASGVDTRRIFFEITETAAVANLGHALRFINALKKKGCRFVLDDFGSGLSSFAYLKNLPVDMLKIDGEFVRNMEIDPIREAMVAAINQVGQVMGLETIAEWVESEATYERLEQMGVDFVQGYLIHRPEATS